MAGIQSEHCCLLFLKLLFKCRTDWQCQAKALRRCFSQSLDQRDSRVSGPDMPSTRIPNPSIQVSQCLNMGQCQSIEPIGSAKPKFPEDTNIKGIVRRLGSRLSLSCPAQAYPMPSYRSVQSSIRLTSSGPVFRQTWG